MKKMSMRETAVVLSLLSFWILSSCSSSPTVEASAPISTLEVQVSNEEGQPLGGAEVYLNGHYEGKTSSYGENAGTWRLLLPGPENKIFVKKEGYIPSVSTSISTSENGEQYLSIILDREKTALNVDVQDTAEKTLPQVTVSLQPLGKETQAESTVENTDKRGQVHFLQAERGKYLLKARKPGFITSSQEVELQQAEEEITLTLQKLPSLLIQIQDEEGNSLGDAEVTLYAFQEYHAPGAFPLHITSSTEEGVAQFDDVEWGEKYVIVIKKRGFLSQTAEHQLLEDQNFFTFILSKG